MELVADDYEQTREGDEDNVELENYHLENEGNISQGSDEEEIPDEQQIETVIKVAAVIIKQSVPT